MARYRHQTLQAEKSVTVADTLTLDLDVADIISRILVQYKITKSTNAMTAHPIADLTKIEVVDGSTVLWSLSGYEAAGLNYYATGKLPYSAIGAYGGLETIAVARLDFGRKLFDPLLAFDPKKFRNPQLKVSYVLTTSDSGASAGKIKVDAFLFDELKPSPIGYLLAKEVKTYTPGADGVEEAVELPDDYKIRKVLARAAYAGYEPWVVVDETKLTENTGKTVIQDIDSMEGYVTQMRGVWPDCIEDLMTTYNPGASIRYVAPSDYFTYISSCSGGVAAGYHTGYLRGGKINWTQGSPGQEYHGRTVGQLPHHVIEFAPWDAQDPEDWWNPVDKGKCELKLKAGASGSSGSVTVFTEQLKTY